MINLDQERLRFEELLVFYVNDTLSADDKNFMESYLERFPEHQAQVAFMQSLNMAVNNESHVFDSEPGLTKLLAQYKSLQKEQTLGERLGNLCRKWGFSPAFGLAFGLLVAQTALIFQLGFFTSSVAYRGVSTQSEYIAHLKITIDPKTDYAQLVDLLRKNGCKVVSGPSANGELWIHLQEPEKQDIIVLDLFNSGLVDEVLSLKINN